MDSVGKEREKEGEEALGSELSYLITRPQYGQSQQKNQGNQPILNNTLRGPSKVLQTEQNSIFVLLNLITYVILFQIGFMLNSPTDFFQTHHS